jgi:hypothetical protein
MFLNNNTYLFDCAIELIEADGPKIVNIEEFEALSEVSFFGLRLRAFLSDLGPQIGLKSIDHQERLHLRSNNFVHL